MITFREMFWFLFQFLACGENTTVVFIGLILHKLFIDTMSDTVILQQSDGNLML